MTLDPLFRWVSLASGAPVRDARDAFDGEVLLRAFERAIAGECARGERLSGEDAIGALGRRLRHERLRDGTDALRARDETGTKRLVREMYAESLRRRAAAFGLARERETEARFERATPSPSARRRVAAEIVDRSAVTVTSTSESEDDGGSETEAEEETDAVDELDLTDDWLALESPVRPRASPAATTARAGFVTAAEMLRELNLNERSVEREIDVGSRGSAKTLSRTPRPVPKTLRLWKSEPPKERTKKPLKWELIFDEPGARRDAMSFERLFSRVDSRKSSSTSPSRSPPERRVNVSWPGDGSLEENALQLAARRRGLFSSSSSSSRRGSSPERRRSDAGVAACYVPPARPSNKRAIRSALRVLVGPGSAEAQAVDACEYSSVVLLLKGPADVAPRKLRGVYAVATPDALVKIYGGGPEYIEERSIVDCLKYDTVTSTFERLPSSALTPTVAAIALTRTR